MHRFGALFVVSLVTFSHSVFALPSSEPVRIGIMAELSGPYASIGEECQRGWQIAQEAKQSVLPKNLEIVTGDHQRDPKTGVSEFQHLVGEKGAIGLAFNASPIGLAINSLSSARKIPILGSVSHPLFVHDNPYAFRFWTNSDQEGATVAKYAQSLGLKRFAVLTLEDDYVLAVSKAFKDAAPGQGITIVFDDRITKAETDYATIATRIRAAKPDGIFINVLGDQLSALIKKFRELGLTQKFFTSFSLGKPEILQAAGEKNVEGAVFNEIDGEKPWFAKEMNRRFGSKQVTSLNYGCFLSLWTLLSAFEETPSIKTSEELFSALSKMKLIHTPDGDIAMKDREAQLGILFRTVVDGKIETVKG